MSAGKKLLASIIANGATGALVGLERSLFIDDEVSAYEFIRTFYRQYRELPTVALVASEGGIRLPSVSQSLQYHLDSVYNRQIYQNVHAGFGPLREALTGKDVPAIMAAVQALSRAARGARTSNEAYDIAEALDLAIDRLDETRGTGGMVGLPSGWPGWDDQTGGYQGSDVITFAGRMGTGKSYLLIKQAAAAWRHGASTVLFTTEMSTESIARRFLALGMGIDPDILKKSVVSNRLMERVRDYRAAMEDSARFRIISLGMLGATTAKVQEAIEEFGPDACYVDSFYILAPAHYHPAMKKNDKVDQCISELKGAAVDYNIPMILTSGFNRAAGKGGEKGELENLAFSDEVGRVSSIVAGVKLGTGEDEYATRRIAILKGREGESRGIEINFQFRPLNMDEVVVDENSPRPTAAQIEGRPSLDWMENS